MKKSLLLAMALMLSCASAFAQTTVTGTVVDTKGEPMPGAKVQVKGTNQYVITNMDGTFEVELSKPKAKLVSKYAGWNTAAKTAKEGMVIKMSKESWWSEKPTHYQWFVDVNVAVPESYSANLFGASPGIMFGMLKNFGWYVKGQFNGSTEIHNCTTWTTGKTKTEYMSIAGGGIVRLGCPIHLYAGVGYAKHIILDEHACGGYTDRDSHRYSSTEYLRGDNYRDIMFDLGLMLRFKHIFVQGGVQSQVDIEHMAGNFGIGYIF